MSGAPFNRMGDSGETVRSTVWVVRRGFDSSSNLPMRMRERRWSFNTMQLLGATVFWASPSGVDTTNPAMMRMRRVISRDDVAVKAAIAEENRQCLQFDLVRRESVQC